MTDATLMRLSRIIALNKDFIAWSQGQRSWKELAEQLTGETGSVVLPDDCRQWLDAHDTTEMPPSFERAWIVTTGGAHLRVHIEQAVFGLHYRPRHGQAVAQ